MKRVFRKGMRVQVNVKQPKSQFDGRKGIVAGRSDWGRILVHFDKSPKDEEVEFLRSELVKIQGVVAMIHLAEGKITEEITKSRWLRWKGRCLCCGKILDYDSKPKSCGSCNSSHIAILEKRIEELENSMQQVFPKITQDGMAEYPTEEQLLSLSHYDVIGKNLSGIADEIRECYNEDYGKIGFENGQLYLVTGGWSGNEDVIDALSRNVVFWATYWQKSERGGGYWFGRRDV